MAGRRLLSQSLSFSLKMHVLARTMLARAAIKNKRFNLVLTKVYFMVNILTVVFLRSIVIKFGISCEISYEVFYQNIA